jgi:DNA repair protein RadC
MEKTNDSIGLITEIELVYNPRNIKDKLIISTSEDAYKIFIAQWNLNKISLMEEFKLLLLNRANQVLGCVHLSSGGITGTVVDPRLVLVAAIKSASCAIILCHNHPSGNLKPSNADENLTDKLKQACQYHEISLLDHLVISKESYFSFADEGLI